MPINPLSFPMKRSDVRRCLLFGNLLCGLVWSGGLASGAAIPPGAFDRPSAGDNPGEEQPPPRGYDIPPTPVLSPEEALKSFRLPPGYRMELVASEPLISAPVAIDFDPDGRIWVVEMRGYQNNPEGSDRLNPVGRISILEDTNGDGKMDRSTVYLDGLVLPRSIKVLSDGVLVAEPPNVWFTRDTNGDGRADEKVSIADDYGLKEGNPANSPSGLMWGMDNRLHSTTYSGFFRRIDGKWTKTSAPALGKWGLGMDDFGRTYMAGSSGPLRANLIAVDYQLRNPHIDGAGGVHEIIAAPAQLEVWPARPTPGVNRGYQKDGLRKDGTLVHYTAAAGLTIFRGDGLPAELVGNHFIAEPAANLVRRSVLTEMPDGRLVAANPHTKSEFLASTDERFRPVNLNTAPDGTLYFVDMYRGILEAHPFVTTYLKRQIYERGLQLPLDRGRIYRVVHESMKPGPAPRLSRLDAAGLVATLSHRNGWWRDTAQRLLVERHETSAAPALRRLAATAEWEIVRLHALWTLEGLNALNTDDMSGALNDRHPKIRAAGVRLAEPWLRQRDGHPLAAAVIKAAGDLDASVRLQAAVSLGELGGPAAEAALAELLSRYASQPYIVAAAISSLPGRELEFLQRLGGEKAWAEARPEHDHVFKALAAAVFGEGSASRVTELLRWAAARDRAGWQQQAVLGSMTKPVRLSARVEIPAEFTRSPDPRVVTLAGQLDRHLLWAGRNGAGGELTAAERALLRAGEKLYAVNCTPCHQADGRGLADTALPLAGSKWVLGADELLARIVLLGKQGKISLMPPWGNVLEDRQMASILTYVRNAWGNKAAAVLPETIRKVRSETRTKSGFWTDDALTAEATRLGLKP
ncbi:MAG: dehydrogenase [Opitutus sp.]|nr:dehydrogenase [Opitutus sp.]